MRPACVIVVGHIYIGAGAAQWILWGVSEYPKTHSRNNNKVELHLYLYHMVCI